MEIGFLNNFGMTKTEVKVYLHVIRFGETSIGPIIKSTGLHRGTVYNAINDLMEKGFLSFVDREGVRYYKSTGRDIFNNILDERSEENTRHGKEMEKFFTKISDFQHEPGENEVAVFYGLGAFKTALLGVYSFCGERNCEYLFMGTGGELYNATGEGFYRYTQRLKRQMGLKCRIIFDSADRENSHHKLTVGEIGFLSTKVYSPANFWIYGDYVLFVLFRANPLTSIKIKSKFLADSFRNYFEYLWSASEKKKVSK